MSVIIPNKFIIQLLELIKYKKKTMLGLKPNNVYGVWFFEREVSLEK